MSKFDAATINAEFSREISDLARQMVRMEELESYLNQRPYDWPNGADWTPAQYDLRYAAITVRVPEVNGREWRGLKGTAGIVYRVRQYFGITKLARDIDYSGDTTFTGNFTVGDRMYWVRIDCGKQLPDSCRLVEEEVTETVTRKKYRTVCD